MTPSEKPLDYLLRILPHLDHRDKRDKLTTPFQFELETKMLAVWREGAVLSKGAGFDHALTDLERLFAHTQGATAPSTRTARERFNTAHMSRKPFCWTPYFGIRMGRDLVLYFTGRDRDPELVTKVNAWVAEIWPEVVAAQAAKAAA